MLTKVAQSMMQGPPFNYAQNAEFRYFQRQTPGTLTSYSDDNYGPDRWYVLNSGGNTQVARVTEVISSSPSPYVCQVRQADGSSQRFGIAQILESDRCVRLRGKKVNFSFWARTDGTEVTNLRAALVEWTGTADSVTSDIVSSWAATPTLIANATAVNTPADLALTGTMAQFNITATLGSSFNNLILFVWSSAAEAQNDDFYITQVQLIEGTAPAPWTVVSKTQEEDLRECRRFYEKSYDTDTVIASATDAGMHAFPSNNAGQNARGAVRYQVPKRVSPSVSFWDAAGTGSAYTSYAGNNTQTNNRTTSAAVVNSGINGFAFNGSVTDYAYAIHWASSAEL